jgi:ATP-dependent DNA helicase RecG
MMTALALFEAWLKEPEGERLEFKEAKQNYHFEKLARYCAALSNEGGGRLVLGVTDKRPRKVVGTQAFAEPGRTAAGLTDRLRIKISCEELQHPDGRVLVFHIPARAIGMPVQDEGVYWSRAGDELRPLSFEELRRVFEETVPDFSAELHDSAGVEDLEVDLIERFRRMWRRKSGHAGLDRLNHRQLLEDAELLVEGKVTIAALILLGTHAALGRCLPQAELVFEYRSSDASIPFQQRMEFRRGFLGVLDGVWEAINLRNELLHYQEGMFIGDIAAFNEAVVREAILNAVAHRDYRLPGSIFVRQFPRRLEIVSPGGFPPGITPENLLWRQSPRNRRIAESCAKCGLVERSGQGANRMFEESIKEGKPRPDFTGTDNYQVSLTLRGEIQNPQFLRFLEKVGKERLSTFTTEDLLILDSIQRVEPLAAELRDRLPHLVEQGIIERIGRGRGVRFILSRKFHSFLGKPGAYTRERGLDRETNKALLLKHIVENAEQGARLQELLDVLRHLSRDQVQGLLRELKRDGRVHLTGATKAGRWFPGEDRGRIS